MEKSIRLIAFVCVFCAMSRLFSQSEGLTNIQPLRVSTLNLWTGLDYHGVFNIGEYESPEVRERRFQMVVREFTLSHPDVIALQEVNPVYRVASRLAEALDYDLIYQRVNSGLKIGSLGLPWNLNEGVAFLARKGLNLDFVDVCELAKTSGVFGNSLSLHALEENIALVARIKYRGIPILLLNVHTAATVPIDSSSSAVLADVLHAEKVVANDRADYISRYREGGENIQQELDHLAEYIKERTPGMPRIVLGDFNMPSTSQIMRRFLLKTRLFDVAEWNPGKPVLTWDPGRNTNTVFSTDSLDASNKRLDPSDLLNAWYDRQPRQIDYILVDSLFNRPGGGQVKIIFDSPENGLYASDHFGILAEIPVEGLLSQSFSASDSVEPVRGSELEPLPIISYDTDVGFGYGAKVFYLSPLGLNESFDLVLFNSTKGERWYRFVFSVPDFEVRQGKVYPLAADIIVDYDKYLKNSFFGIGNTSRFNDREYYTREPLELNIVLNRGFSTRVVGQLGLKYKYVRNFNYSDMTRLKSTEPSLSSGIARYHSLFASYRYDSRNSFINPSRGWVLQAEGEYAPQSGLTNVRLGRLGGWVQYYSVLFYPKTVFALRLGMQGLVGDNLPVQMLLPIGGNQTLRGSPQDRYLEKMSAILNAELRFPIFWRFGGVFGYDAGKVWHELRQTDFIRWSTNPVVGLRFFMDTYVVRMDLGFGKETTGFYLNFGHLF